jgi:hypothetical protein
MIVVWHDGCIDRWMAVAVNNYHTSALAIATWLLDA